MALPATIDACKLDLFSPRDELEKKYLPVMVSRILRIREAYTWMLSNPDAKDRDVVNMILGHNPDVSKSSAYSDLAVLKSLLPLLAQNSREFHRWRCSEMLLETFQLARRRKDTKTMERAATSYGKLHRIDLDDEMEMPWDKIVVQPYIATMDVSVLGLTPRPNTFDYIARLTKELSADFPDIVDVEAEDADLLEDKLFAPLDEGKEDDDDA